MSAKRKREPDLPRVVFHARDRYWERVLQEDSLDELRQVVLKRLALPSGSTVQMWRLTDGRKYELFEEDDFDAFYAAILDRKTMQVEVNIIDGSEPDASRSVSVNNESTADSLDESVLKKLKFKHHPHVSFTDETAIPLGEPISDQIVRDSGANSQSMEEPVFRPPKKKRRKKNPGIAPDLNDETHSSFVEGLAEAIQDAAGVGQVEEQEDAPPPPPPKKRRSSRKVHANDASNETASPNEDPTLISPVEPALDPDQNEEQEDVHPPPSPPPPPPPKKRRSSRKSLTDAANETASLTEDPMSVDLEMDEKPVPPKRKRRKSRTSASDTESEDQPSSSRPKRAAQRIKERMIAVSEGSQVKQESKKLKKLKSRGQIVGTSTPTRPEEPPTEQINEIHIDSPSVLGNPHSSLAKSHRISDTQPSSSDSSCPVCGESPLHQRYHCPVILAGPVSLRSRIDSLVSGGHTSLAAELRTILSNLAQPQGTGQIGKIISGHRPSSPARIKEDNIAVDKKDVSSLSSRRAHAQRENFDISDNDSSEREEVQTPLAARPRAPPIIAVTTGTSETTSPTASPIQSFNRECSVDHMSVDNATTDESPTLALQQDLEHPEQSDLLNDVTTKENDTREAVQNGIEHAGQDDTVSDVPDDSICSPATERPSSPLPNGTPHASTGSVPQKHTRTLKDRLGRTSLSALTTRAFTQFQKIHQMNGSARSEGSPFAISMPPPTRSSPDAGTVSESAQPAGTPTQGQSISLTQWTTLGGTSVSENGDTQSCGQMDELLPSSSPDTSTSRYPLPSSPTTFDVQGTPLFLDATQPLSQRTYAPSPTVTKMRLRSLKAASMSDNEEHEVEQSIGFSQRSTASRPSLPPTLKQLRGRSFASPQLLVTPQGNQNNDIEYDAYGRRKGEADSESSDSEASHSEKESHIPISRRAGGSRGLKKK